MIDVMNRHTIGWVSRSNKRSGCRSWAIRAKKKIIAFSESTSSIRVKNAEKKKIEPYDRKKIGLHIWSCTVTQQIILCYTHACSSQLCDDIWWWCVCGSAARIKRTYAPKKCFFEFLRPEIVFTRWSKMASPRNDLITDTTIVNLWFIDENSKWHG